MRLPFGEQPRLTTVVVVRVETYAGLVGYGAAGPPHAAPVEALINPEIVPFLVGRDVLLAGGLAPALERRFTPRAMSRVVSCALSSVDVALWDVRDKILGQPVWRLLEPRISSIRARLTGCAYATMASASRCDWLSG